MPKINLNDLDSSNNFNIFLDMDNVLTDFNLACNNVFDGLFNMHSTDRDSFWRIIAEQGIPFWAKMPWKKDGKELCNHLLKYNTRILSAHPNPKRGEVVEFSKKGKYEWLAKEIGKDFADRAIICRRAEKELYAGPECILVDDNSENIELWEKAGGIGVLHSRTENTIEKLNRILK
ncbi:MAG: hypothetical protein AB3K77_00790 [Methanosarcinaceae archaeon]